MADKTMLLLEAIKIYFPTANFKILVDAKRVLVGYNKAAIDDMGVATVLFETIGIITNCEFDGYGENNAACFILN